VNVLWAVLLFVVGVVLAVWATERLLEMIASEPERRAAVRRYPLGALPVAASVLTARPISTAMTTSEMSDWAIVSTFARRLRIAVSVGLKAVLVLKARKR